VSRAAYDEIADWYDDALDSLPFGLFHDFSISVVLDLVGEVQGRRVCDLACGQGVVARKLAERGASVDGVDISEKMLHIARRYEQEEPLGITYLLDDARTLDRLDSDVFDGVVCNMALMDVADVSDCLDSVARILRPGGWFVFSITHPCFPTPSLGWGCRVDAELEREKPNYFAECFWRRDNTAGVRGRVGSHHRTLSTYVNAMIGAGLRLERIVEPRAPGDLAERISGYLEVPPFLAVRCSKGPAPIKA
jgi:2-polyprenyl-3-methyl-5-hydroxy-6-metoxy-1,4-benzoquinol methylase